jgi:DNA (cytosine-5)-methyltransferase 1
MKYLSVCSGIEAATVAWHPLGWTPLAFSEIEPFPRKVLEHHYPDVRLEGDFTLLREQQWIKDADILVGGTPCQAFSVAGLRNSLDDDRGNLTLEFVRLADAIDALRSVPSTVVWENVPGVLSVKDNAFGCFLGALAGEDAPLVAPGGRWSNAGFVDGPKRAIAWRILDAQYFGVAQRRRRLFVVASARTDFDPAQVLFEFEGVRRDIAPSREKGQEPSATIAARFGISRNNHEEVVTQFVGEVAPTLTKEGTGVVRPGFQEDGWYVAVAGSLDTQCGGGKLTHQSVANGHIVAARMVAFGEYVDDGTASTMKSRDYKDATDLVTQPVTYSIMPMNSGKDYKAREVDVSPPIMAGGPVGGNQGGDYIMQPIPLDLRNSGRDPEKYDAVNRQGVGVGEPGDPAHTVTSAFVHGMAQGMAVRRLTPRECERLQGFPDDYTAIPKAADGPRYKALGNSMAVPVMAWIGKRIANALA